MTKNNTRLDQACKAKSRRVLLSAYEKPGNTMFSIGIGNVAHTEYQFRVNNVISGECMPGYCSDLEPGSSSVPWELVPPVLEVY